MIGALSHGPFLYLISLWWCHYFPTIGSLLGVGTTPSQVSLYLPIENQSPKKRKYQQCTQHPPI